MKNKKNKITEITAKAGTLILVDTSYLHRGKPLENNSRYALTNYFFLLINLRTTKTIFNQKLKI